MCGKALPLRDESFPSEEAMPPMFEVQMKPFAFAFNDNGSLRYNLP